MNGRTFTIVAFAAALVVAGFVSFYASPHPDGLMYVADSQGFAATETASLTHDSPLAGYSLAWISDARLSGGLAGVIGCVACFALMSLVTLRRGADRVA